ncbi:MAG: DUF5052 family protein [Propionibacteriaceae bacterium]|jgi:hypothetical protein|nr:DUF5052 family protein [Propionibacteriaceae bacterium]
MRKIFLTALTIMLGMTLTSCALFETRIEQFDQAWTGVRATMYTYAFDGTPMDRVKGTSFRVARDKKFDETTVSGDVKKGSVIMISLGKDHISHVGSTLVLEQDGLERLAGGDEKIDVTNTNPGIPWLNDLVENWRNNTRGKAKIVFIKSQSSVPIAVYAGDHVEIMATDIPNSTWFRIDGKYLFVYRCEFTVYDAKLL